MKLFLLTDKGFIWVGTKSGGVSRYNQAKDEFINFSHELDPESHKTAIRITDIVEDTEGNIWIAIWGMGLFKLNSETYELERSFLPNKIIQEVEVDDFGNVWGVANNLIHKYDPSEDRLISLSVPIGAGMALHYDSL